MMQPDKQQMTAIARLSGNPDFVKFREMLEEQQVQTDRDLRHITNNFQQMQGKAGFIEELLSLIGSAPHLARNA